MSAMHAPAATIVKTPCRVCGEPIRENAQKCSRCGTPKFRSDRESTGAGWGDVVLASLGGILALALGAPLTFMLSVELWNGPRGWNDLPVALIVTAFSVGLIGLPLGVTLWRWRDRALEGETQHIAALREYWQIQLLCLLPFAAAGLFIGAFWIIAVYFSD